LWLVDVVAGGILGGVVGGVVALNLMILSGVDNGYEASIAEVFDHQPVFGALVVAALVAGPVLGVFAARRWRQRHRDKGE
jgi:predicted transporter